MHALTPHLPAPACRDPHWRALLRYACDNGTCKGAPMPAPDDGDENGGPILPVRVCYACA